MSDLGNFQQNPDGNHHLLTENDVSVVVVTAAGGSNSSVVGGISVGDSNSGVGSGAFAVGNVPVVRRSTNRFSPVSNQLRKRFLSIASKQSSSASSSGGAAAATISAKRQKTNNSSSSSSDENQHKQQSSNMNMSEGDGGGGERRLNFSAVSSGANGSVLKMPTNSSSKPGDIRKLVIKNFKGLHHTQPQPPLNQHIFSFLFISRLYESFLLPIFAFGFLSMNCVYVCRKICNFFTIYIRNITSFLYLSTIEIFERK